MSRKYRWTFEATFPSGKIEPTFVTISKRPEVNYLAKSQPEPEGEITTTFFDRDEKKTVFWKIMSDCYDLLKDNVSLPESCVGEAILKLHCPTYNWLSPVPPATIPEGEVPTKNPTDLGLGLIGGGRQINGWEVLEQWTLKKIWPTNINFGELDYSSNDEAKIEVTWRYNQAILENIGSNLNNLDARQ